MVRVILIACFRQTAHNFELCSTDETIQSLEKRGAEFQAKRSGPPPPTIPNPMSITYTEEDDPFAIDSDSQKVGHIKSLSGFQWVHCGKGIYVIELVGKGFIRIEHQGMEVN